MERKIRGSLTVFFSMSFSVILMFLTALLALGRRELIRVGIRRDMDLSAYSLQAEYQRDWIEQQGLYMMPLSGIQSGFSFYMEQNSRHPYGSYSVKTLTVTPVKTLADTAVLQAQISRFMKERGVLSVAEELWEAIAGLKEEEKIRQVQTISENSEALLELQLLYAQLVTDFHGIRNDGGMNPYYINGLLRQKPSSEEVDEVFGKILRKENPDSKDQGVLEQALSDLSEVEILCRDAKETAAALEKQLRQLEEEGEEALPELPISKEDMLIAQEVAENDEQVAKNAKEALEELLHLMDASVTDPSEEDMAEQMEVFWYTMVEYNASLQLPYEYREPTGAIDLKALWHYLQGFDEDIDQTAPDQELELKLEGIFSGAAEDEEVDGEEKCPDFSEAPVGEEALDRFYLTEYCLGMYQNFLQTRQKQEGEDPTNLRGEKISGHFLQNGTEYLLVGKPNEYDNVNHTRLRLVSTRAALNMAYLMVDPQKKETLEAAAAGTGGILLPGVGNAVAFGALLAAWGWGEAVSDYRILIDGGKVPLWKDEESWNLDLWGLLEYSTEEGAIERSKGLTYRQYLRILLYLMPEQTLLKRVQELLYIDHGFFPLTEAVVSYEVEGEVGSRSEAGGLGGTEYFFSGVYGYD